MTHIDPSFFDSFAIRGGAQRDAAALDNWRFNQAGASVDVKLEAGAYYSLVMDEYRRLVRENITPETGEA